MRKPLLLVALALVAAGCAQNRTTDALQPLPTEPVAVRLLPPEGGFLRFLTSEPAHVAVFEIAPERGVSLLYPHHDAQAARVSSAGINVELLPWRPQGRWYYASTMFYPSYAAATRPTYLYIIASRTPLKVDEIRASPGTLRSSLGWHSFLAADLSGTLDALENLVVREAGHDDWSSDLYVIWPEVRLDRPWHTQYVFVQCPDGRIAVLPWGWNVKSCPGTRNLAQATEPTTPTSPPASPPDTDPKADTSGAPVKPKAKPADENPNQPLAPRRLGVEPSSAAPEARARIHTATSAPHVSDRVSEPAPARTAEPRAAPEPRTAPAPSPPTPRIEAPIAPTEPREREAAEPKRPVTP